VVGGSSSFLMVHGVGAMFGPAFSGVAMGLLGAVGLPLIFVVVQFLLAFYSLVHLRRPDEVVNVEEQSHFVPMLRTTPTVMELHPEQRNESVDDTPAASNEPSDYTEQGLTNPQEQSP